MGAKILFIINKFSGTGYQPQSEGKILDICERHDVECTIEFTNGKGHATELARNAVGSGFDRVIAVGGDGTVNEVARGLLHTGMPLGILPKGSGNGLARHLGIPVSIPAATESIFKSTVVSMDTFKINDHLSVNVAGLGFDGLIANMFDTNGQRGLSGYVKLTLKEFINFRDFQAKVSVNGMVMERDSFIIAVANSSQYGNNARIAPRASVKDSMLQVSFIRKVPYHRIPSFAYAFFAGTIEKHKRYYESFSADNLSIDTPVPTPFHVDGEACGASDHFSVQVNPRSLNILVPEEKAATV